MEFLSQVTGTRPEHLGRYCIDPAVLAGNIENFVGAAQVPIGIAGPLPIDGEHARGEFYVPLATTEGTLVASYNRGMKLLHRAGGVKTTVMHDVMQRAPVFGFLFLRFNFTTGDAAGQNLAGKAAWRACNWIRAHYPGVREFYLESNLATDKKGYYYYSITIPALIVATYGGGTGLPTQRECLELLGCYGAGQVRKLAEIVAATVLCGEISLGSAVVADEWVAAHERLGRNRP
jgi:hydroxymethylglutaryl-CoA reductase